MTITHKSSDTEYYNYLTRSFLKKKKYEIDDNALELALDITKYDRNYPNFANARTIRNIFHQVILNQNLRTKDALHLTGMKCYANFTTSVAQKQPS